MHAKTLDAICEVFDAIIVWNYTDDPERDTTKDICSLGSWGDMSVGIQSFFLTPWFDDEDALRRYVESEAGWREINKKAAETFPDDWDAQMQGWKSEGCNAFSGHLWHSD